MKQPPKCKECGKELDHNLRPNGILVKYCIEHIAKRQADKARASREKKARKEKIEGRKRLMTVSDYEGKLQTEINAIIRLIDNGHNCMSCLNDKTNKRLNAGHYHSVGSNHSLRFNLMNIWAQCHDCNGMNSGNTIGYNKGLIRIYGKEFQEYVEYQLPLDYPYMKFRIDQLVEAKKIASAIKLSLQKENRIYTNLERKEMRIEFNTKIGIYL